MKILVSLWIHKQSLIQLSGYRKCVEKDLLENRFSGNKDLSSWSHVWVHCSVNSEFFSYIFYSVRNFCSSSCGLFQLITITVAAAENSEDLRSQIFLFFLIVPQWWICGFRSEGAVASQFTYSWGEISETTLMELPSEMLNSWNKTHSGILLVL